MPKLVLINPSVGGYSLARQGLKLQPLNLAYLAALTPGEWEIRIDDENYATAGIDPTADLVGITTLTSTINRAYELADGYRQAGIKVVLGGIHASMCPDEAKAHADAVVIGEAESVWPQVLADAPRRLRPTYQGTTLPFQRSIRPRRDLLSPHYSFGSIQTSRGCPFDCEFCSVKAFNGSVFRQREVEDILNELQTLPQKYLFFADDNLIGYSPASRDRAKAIFRGMIDRKLQKKWFCQTSLNFADDEELLDLAVRSGCMVIIVGIESIDDRVLKGNMNKSLNSRKGVKYYQSFIAKLHAHGIVLLGTMIFGNDEASEDAFDQASRFYAQSGLDIPWPGILTPYPGTRLHERLSRENRIRFQNYPEDWKKYNSTIVIATRHGSPEQFFEKFKRFVRTNFSLSRVLGRALRTWLYSRDLTRALLVYDFNRSLDRRFRKGLASGKSA